MKRGLLLFLVIILAGSVLGAQIEPELLLELEKGEVKVIVTLKDDFDQGNFNKLSSLES